VIWAVRPTAIRRRNRIPLRFADDYSTTAAVVSFTGLTDAQQHVAYISAAQILHALGANRIVPLAHLGTAGR
jgi:hypothetical protein